MWNGVKRLSISPDSIGNNFSPTLEEIEKKTKHTACTNRNFEQVEVFECRETMGSWYLTQLGHARAELDLVSRISRSPPGNFFFSAG